MKMPQRYDKEQQQLKKDMEELQRQCDKENNRAFCKEQFLKAVRKFMEMKTLTPTILHELVERIDVYQTQGRGKSRTQRIVIHYNFIGHRRPGFAGGRGIPGERGAGQPPGCGD